MIEKTTCKYCGWKFPVDFIQNNPENNDSVFCENCGTEIINLNARQIEAKPEIYSKNENKKNSKVSRIYEKLRIEKDPIDRVLDDSDFPLIFKENFNLVICRIIFDSLRDLVDILQLKANQIELSEALIHDIEYNLEPIMNSRVNDAFITNLHKIPRKAFENHLKRFQSKIERSTHFRKDFKVFLRWLINMVYELLSYSGEPEDLPKMEQTILKDLRSFNLESQNTSGDSDEIEAGINRKRSKYWFLDEDEQGNLLPSNEERIKGAAKYIEDNIIPDLVEKKIINTNQRPTTQDFRVGKWSGFMYQLHKRKIDFKLVMAEIGFQKISSKYSFMYYDKKGNPLNRFEKIREARKYFESKIIPSLVKDNLIEAGQIPSTKILEQTSHDNFLEALYKNSGENCKIYYKDFLWWSGYDNVLGRNIWTFLDRDEYGNDLDYQGKVNSATDYFIEKIVPDLIDKELISENQIPLQRDLNRPDYYLFVKAFRRRGIHFGHILENAGYLYEDEYAEQLLIEDIEKKLKVIEQDRDLFKSWEFLYQKPDNSLRTRGETINVAANYLLETIIPELKEKKVLSHNKTPRYNDLAENEYAGFLTTLGNGKWSIRYNEIVQTANLSFNKDTISYDFLNRTTNHNERLEQASKYFKDKIYPVLIKDGLIKKGQSPTKEIIYNTLFRNFIWAIEGHGLRYNDILKFNSLEVNRPSFKWNFLFEDENNQPYSLNETLKIATEYFKKNIITKMLDEGKIVQGQIPFRNMVNKFSGFLYALLDSRFQISYTELVESSGLIPNTGPILSKVGMNFHQIAEKLFLQHTRESNCHSFYESKGFDNVIFIDDAFKKLSKEAKKLAEKYKNVKVVIIDYYLGNSRENIDKHIKRGYQGNGRLLILVPNFAQKSSELPDIKNVELMSPDKFADLIGYGGEFRSAFFEAIGLAKESIYDLKARLILRRKAVKNLRIIKETYPFKEKEFLDFLRKSNQENLLN